MRAHVRASLFKDEGLADRVGDLGMAVDEAVGEFFNVVHWDPPVARICMQQQQ